MPSTAARDMTAGLCVAVLGGLVEVGVGGGVELGGDDDGRVGVGVGIVVVRPAARVDPCNWWVTTRTTATSASTVSTAPATAHVRCGRECFPLISRQRVPAARYGPGCPADVNRPTIVTAWTMASPPGRASIRARSTPGRSRIRSQVP